MDMLEWLENWYLSKCNGDWEHNYGIKINTLDNPGWEITIDLTDVGIKVVEEEWKLFEKNEKDWYGYKINQYEFNAAGDPAKLNFLISLFRDKITVGNE